MYKEYVDDKLQTEAEKNFFFETVKMHLSLIELLSNLAIKYNFLKFKIN